MSRVLQSSISNTLEQEFVETAIVRGLSQRILIWRYLLRPSLAPTIALIGFTLGRMLGGLVVIELVFNLPGMGTLLVAEGLAYRDYPLVQGVVLILGVIVVIINFLCELLSEWLDPRIKTT
jgi:peptide/nickel transport system permease protein